MPRLALLISDRPEEIRTFRLPHSGRTLRYRLRKSSRARYARLEIRPESGLRVILPRFYPLKKAEELLVRKEAWILKHLTQIRNKPKTTPPLQEGSVVSYKGIPHTLTLRRHGKSYFAVQLKGRTIEIRAPQTETVPFAEILESWFRWQAKIQIEQLARQLAGRFKLSFGRVTIRDQKTRWGSCSARGNLNFNWRLLMAPAEVLRYVVIHELTHLEQPNHSQKFWARVEKRCPHYRKHEQWLKQHGADLRQILRTNPKGDTT